MVALLLGNDGDPVDQLDARHEAFELVRVREHRMAVDLGDLPAWNLGLQSLDGRRLQLRRAGFAADTAPFGQRDGHGSMLGAGNIDCPFGRLAQWESACFTRKRSLVQTQCRPPIAQRGPVV